MSTLYKFNTEQAATEYIGIIEAYLDFKLEVDEMPVESIHWMEDNLNGRVACFYEYRHKNHYFVVLFEDAEDAVAFKLRFL